MRHPSNRNGWRSKEIILKRWPTLSGLSTGFFSWADRTTVQTAGHRKNIKVGELQMIFRIMLVGSKMGPGVFVIAETIGKEETVGRIEKYFQYFKQNRGIIVKAKPLLWDHWLACISLLFVISCSKSGEDPVPVDPTPTTDSFTVTINNGYGSGKYKTGDTVHIFSVAYTDNQLFDKWTGDISLLNAPNEWHTWFIMPGNNINITGALKT